MTDAPQIADNRPPGDRSAGPTRRQILGMLGAGGVAAAGGYRAFHPEATVPGTLPRPAPAARPATIQPTPPLGTPNDRLLVVIELRGGNDGLATVIPDSGRLRDLRPTLLTDDTELIDFADDFRLHAGLGGVRDMGLAVVQGVGTLRPDGSHFEMEQRWWQGDSSGDLTLRTGFLGRLCDELAPDAGTITGVTVGSAASPFIAAARATTVGIPDPWGGWFLGENGEWFRNLKRGLADLGAPSVDDAPMISRARSGLTDALAFGDLLESLEQTADGAEASDTGYGDSELAFNLRIAAGLLAADAGLRVVHLELGGFDTHDAQMYTHDDLVQDLGSSLTAFRQDLAGRGLAERTLIATTSEFGRRPEENQSGTDHGTANAALLCGPIATGLFGDAPDLSRLDADGNLVATTMLDDYYATLAQGWFGIDAGLVLPEGGTVVSELFA